MTQRDDNAYFGADPRVAEAMEHLDNERRKLADMSRMWEERSTVRSKDQSFTMTFNGRGDLVDLAFNGNKYRNLPPAQLAHMIMETMQQGKLAGAQRMAEAMGSEALPGVDLVGLATGKVDPSKVVDSLMGPMLNGLGEGSRRPRG